jgi:hypothetical protein
MMHRLPEELMLQINTLFRSSGSGVTGRKECSTAAGDRAPGPLPRFFLTCLGNVPCSGLLVVIRVPLFSKREPVIPSVSSLFNRSQVASGGPAFSGLPTDNAKWLGISGSSWPA